MDAALVRGMRRRWQSGGPRAVAHQALRLAYHRFGGDSLYLPLSPTEIADPGALDPVPPAERPPRGRPLRIGWVMTPPSPGSGGHTTALRMVQALEEAGHECVLFLYERHEGDLAAHRRVIRENWPQVNARVEFLPVSAADVDAFVATAWLTAHVLASRAALGGRRLYFVQDYEPYFHAHGYDYSIAEDSYRFGFRLIALGHTLAAWLRQEVGADPDVVEFSCDTEVYRPPSTPDRSGVVFYAKPGTSRRGFALAVLALEEFHRREPQQEIHFYGETPSGLPFPVVQHGRMTPEELSELYGRTAAGLALSFSNISLVPEEMLACGVIPVLNDYPGADADLDSPYAVWTRPHPKAIADALVEVVRDPDLATRSELAAKSVSADNWLHTGRAVVHIVEDEVYGGRPEVP